MQTFLKPLFGAAIAVTALSACGQKPAEPASMPLPVVSVAEPLQEDLADWDTFIGRFEASQHVDVRARAGGFVQGVHFTDGQRIRKGQLLFTLDPRPAQAALAAAEADADTARRAFERAELLIGEQAISREEFDRRRAALDVAEATLRARRLDLEFTRITAPVDGTVSDRRIDAGNVIAGGSSQADILTTIVATDPIYFAFDASESQLLKYQRQIEAGGGQIEIRLQDESDYRWSGVVDFSDNVIDGASGAVRMRAVVDNPDGFLKPGMFGDARVQGSARYAALLIPDTAVLSDGPRKIAYVVAEDGTVGVKPLEVGEVIDGLRVVRGGLEAGDHVVVNGLMRAAPGATVQTRTAAITRTAALNDTADTAIAQE